MATNKTIITIGRQYGSGGHEIGATIAHDMGLKLYDKEMLKRAAKESGLCEELFETHDEKPTNSFLAPYGSEKQELFVKPSPSSGLMSPSLQA